MANYYIPPEVQQNVLKYADISEYPKLKLVCKQWKVFIERHLPLGGYARLKWSTEESEEKEESPFFIHTSVLKFTKSLTFGGIYILNSDSDAVKAVDEFQSADPFNANENWFIKPAGFITKQRYSTHGKLYYGKADITWCYNMPLWRLDQDHQEYELFKDSAPYLVMGVTDMNGNSILYGNEDVPSFLMPPTYTVGTFFSTISTLSAPSIWTAGRYKPLQFRMDTYPTLKFESQGRQAGSVAAWFWGSRIVMEFDIYTPPELMCSLSPRPPRPLRNGEWMSYLPSTIEAAALRGLEL
ncbi:hypothetical protein TWF481_004565 [Arthrobotrys musiformis]|uniref:F-box domain-containing protein n=1 Tax=Arthrobotrys musiformis TaxID=47236 RepID=A0AAV9WKV6_9PEZI